MGATSSPGPPTTPLEPGMPRLVLWSAILSTGTLPGCRPLLTLPMGSTSSPDPPITLFEFGMRRLVLQLAILSRGTSPGVVCCLLFQWAAHHLQIHRLHHSNLGYRDWYPSRRYSRGAHWLGAVRCLLSRWAPHHLRILRQHNSNLGCRDWCSSRQSSRGAR